jgi:DNA polymerase-3 subunit delta'
MASELVLHNSLQTQIEAFIKHPTHAVLLYGKKSAGKKAIALYIADALMSSRSHSKIMTIAPLEDKKTIGIDQIKQLKQILRTKDESYRILFIPEAEKLTTEAQNSFLKLLEEPSDNVVFILTANNEYRLLETIRSRLLKLRYVAPTKHQQEEFVISKQGVADEKLLVIADGRMGLLSALLNKEVTHEMLQKIELSKDILSESVDDRLVRVDSLSKDSESTATLLDALLLTSNAALKSAIQNDKQYKRWLERLTAIEAAIDQLQMNITAKLVLTRLFLVV